MDYRSGDYPEYPGSDIPALKGDFEALVYAAQGLSIAVTHDSGGSYFSPTARLINVDTKTPTQRGFVSLGQLTDEFLHAWNQVRGRGKYLPSDAAKMHRTLGATAERYGTRALGISPNAAFYKLEALNFLDADEHIPTFMWRSPLSRVRQFAWSWTHHF